MIELTVSSPKLNWVKSCAKFASENALRQERRRNLVDLVVRLEGAQHHPDDGQKQ